jgi:hypothetical protein
VFPLVWFSVFAFMCEENFSGSAKKFVLAVSVAFGVLLLAGCGDKPTPATKAEEPVVIGPQYSAKKGLFVPKDTSDSLGLRVVDVTEQKIPATVDVQLRVYQNTSAGSLASATVPPDKTKLLKAGQTIEVRMTSGENISGTIKEVNTRMEKATGAAELLVEIPIAKAELAIGSFLPARVTLEATESVVTIPRAALLQCSDGHSVYTVSGDHLVRTPIKIGSSTAEFVEVTDGLYAGDKVVLQSVMSLWMTELAAVKGGQACCVEPAKKK